MTSVRICQCSASEWFVGVGAGHYANPIPKETALYQAELIARGMEEKAIDVYDLDGQLLERISLHRGHFGEAEMPWA